MRVLSYLGFIIGILTLASIMFMAIYNPFSVSDKEFFIVLAYSFMMFFVGALFDTLATKYYSTEMERKRRQGIWNAILGTGTCLGVLVWVMIEL